MFILVDCNNFYVSCERLFRPELRNRPVVVLSNNDGCIVARSNEIKEMGIPMGKPLFEVEHILRESHTAIFSSNYALYGDISRRVMTCLQKFSPYIEEYSIDEAFLFIPDISIHEYEKLGVAIRTCIWREIGIPVSVGIAPTKTMAKIANHIAKKHNPFSKLIQSPNGVCHLFDPMIVQEIYRQITVDEIWGVGQRYTQKLNAHQIFSISDFCKTSEHIIQKIMTRTGVLTHRELRGIACIELQQTPSTRKTIVYSRSFGNKVSGQIELQKILSCYATEFTKKLRRHKMNVVLLQIFLSPPYNLRKQQSRISSQIRIPQPTSDYLEITKNVLFLFQHMYQNSKQKNLHWKKAGILGLQLESSLQEQIPLFGNREPNKVSNVIDEINSRFGKGTIVVGSSLRVQKDNLMQRNHCSPQYTTRWSDIPIVSV